MKKILSAIAIYTLVFCTFAQQTLPTRDGAAQIENGSGTLKFSVSAAGVGTITPSGTDLIISGALKPTTPLGAAYGGSGASTSTGSGALVLSTAPTLTNATLVGGSVSALTNSDLTASVVVVAGADKKFASGTETGTGAYVRSSGAAVTNLTVVTGGTIGATNIAATGSLAVGGGSSIIAILSAAAELDFGSISTNTTADLTITVTGAGTNSVVMLGLPAASNTNLIFNGFVSATNTVTVRAGNISLSDVDPASGSFRATVIQY